MSNPAICHKPEGFYQIPLSLTFWSISQEGIKILKKIFHSFFDLAFYFDF